MDGLPDGHDVANTPTWRFPAYVFGAPIAAGAAAFSGALVANETGVGVALVLLAVIYAWFFAYEPAIRQMPAAHRIGWVLAGLASSAALVLAAGYALILIAVSTWNS